MTTIALAARTLTLGYGAAVVLRNIDLELRSGEFLALIGPNGAGKSTLLKALSGQLKPMSGHVLLDGRAIADYAPRERARALARIGQNERSAWPFTVAELAGLGRYPHQEWYRGSDAADRTAVDRALERVSMTALRDRPVTELSGGEFQRALLARALAQEASILLLDEPVSNLDLHHQMSMLELFRDLAHSGLAVVISLHDLNLAALFVDALALVANGLLLRRGPPAEVLREDILKAVYGQAVAVRPHPLFSNIPLVLPIPDTVPNGPSVLR